MEDIISALIWTTLAVLISQSVSIILLWGLGLSPGKLIHEIEVVQNPAVGAVFFIISLTTALFVSVYASDGFTAYDSVGDSLLWIGGGLLLATIYTGLSFMIAHRVMGRENDESVYRYLQRELIEEQNASLAFFFGGLAVAPFIAVLFQGI